MERPLSSLIGSSVVARSGEHLGTVEDVVLDPRDGSVVAVRVREGFIFAKKHVLQPERIRAWDGDELEVEDQPFMNPEEVPLLPQRLRSAFSWLGLPVQTMSGMPVGHVDDLSIHMQLLQVRRLEIARTFLGLVPLSSSIVSIERVATVTRKVIILLDDGAERSAASALLRSFRTEPTPALPDLMDEGLGASD